MQLYIIDLKTNQLLCDVSRITVQRKRTLYSTQVFNSISSTKSYCCHWIAMIAVAENSDGRLAMRWELAELRCQPSVADAPVIVQCSMAIDIDIVCRKNVAQSGGSSNIHAATAWHRLALTSPAQMSRLRSLRGIPWAGRLGQLWV